MRFHFFPTIAAILSVTLFHGLASDALAGPTSAELTNNRPSDRLIGTQLSVANTQRSLNFYVNGLGMTVIFSVASADRRKSLLGFGPSFSQPAIILVEISASRRSVRVRNSHDVDRIVLGIGDLDAMRLRLVAAGFAPPAVQSLRDKARMLVMRDPDGYTIELYEAAQI